MLDPIDGNSVMRDFEGNLIPVPMSAVNAKQRRATKNAAERETSELDVIGEALWGHERGMWVDEESIASPPPSVTTLGDFLRQDLPAHSPSENEMSRVSTMLVVFMSTPEDDRPPPNELLRVHSVSLDALASFCTAEHRVDEALLAAGLDLFLALTTADEPDVA